MMKILFLLGKGGVGKSTLSALVGLHLSAKGNNVILTSLDPAHNLSDIFDMQLSARETLISRGLKAIEVNQDLWIKKYLKEAEQLLKKSYSYLTTFSLEKKFAVMQHAPALEEYAMLMAFQNIVSKYEKDDFLVFDMPPTALSLKFFALPQISLIWLKNLLILRREILEKQGIISKLSFGQKTMETDRVKQNINRQVDNWSYLSDLLMDEKITQPLIVENPDMLSKKESLRIEKKLKSMHIATPRFILNRGSSGDDRYALEVPSGTFINKYDLQKSIKRINFKKFDTLICA
jgi:arsenite-transporting ATPase